MLNTFFSEAVKDGSSVKGAIVQNKSGRQAVLAENLVDASGEADVVATTGAPCIVDSKTTWGLLIHMGNVDLETIVEHFLSIEPKEAQPRFEDWLLEYLETPVEDLKRDRHWSHLLDPPPYGHVPKTHSGARLSIDVKTYLQN